VGVGTLVLEGPICKGVNSGGGVPQAGNNAGSAPELIEICCCIIIITIIKRRDGVSKYTLLRHYSDFCRYDWLAMKFK